MKQLIEIYMALFLNPLQFIPILLIITFQGTFRIFGTPELLRKEYRNRKLNTLMVIEAIDT